MLEIGIVLDRDCSIHRKSEDVSRHTLWTKPMLLSWCTMLLEVLMPCPCANGQGAQPQTTDGQASHNADSETGNENFLLKAWQEGVSKHQTTVGLVVTDGVDDERTSFRPMRELRFAEKGLFSLDNQSCHWDLRLQVNRDAFLAGQDLDEDYTDSRQFLVNGSYLSPGGQLIVRGLYWQKAEETWTLQVGSMQHIWGPADGINTLAVMNPQDLRFGLIGDKDTKYVAIPSSKFALTQGATTLTGVYAPWAQPSLWPEKVHNYALKLDNQNFETDINNEDHITLSPSAAVKLDTNLFGADLTALFYNGVDYDPLGIPTRLNIRNNQPLNLEIDQVVVRKTSYGLGYNQTIGPWALKAEGLYTPQKKVLPQIDLSKIQEATLPADARHGEHLTTNIGFNYFTPIRNFLGIPLGETVVTAEYYRQRIYGRDVLPPLLSDLLVTNLRTAALDDRLEINISEAFDLALKGDIFGTKWTYTGDTLSHSLVYSAVGGTTPQGEALGSPFYYWRKNDSVTYEVSYVIK